MLFSVPVGMSPGWFGTTAVFRVAGLKYLEWPLLSMYSKPSLWRICTTSRLFTGRRLLGGVERVKFRGYRHAGPVDRHGRLGIAGPGRVLGRLAQCRRLPVGVHFNGRVSADHMLEIFPEQVADLGSNARSA